MAVTDITMSPAAVALTCSGGRVSAPEALRGLRGQGSPMLTPVMDTLQQLRRSARARRHVSAESTLTRDTVPVFVDAIVFWLVWNAEKSILEVEDFRRTRSHERANGAAGIHWPARSRTR